ncbi:MAG: GNAT family protein [Chloroflexota bacterium]
MDSYSSFQSKRIFLRAFEKDDLPALHEYLNHAEIIGRRYIPWEISDVLPLSTSDIEKVIAKWAEGEKQANLAIIERTQGELIGHACFSWSWDPHCPDLSLVIAPKYQRKGYGSETLKLILDYLFQNTLAHNVSGWIADWNMPARQFVQKHGFKEVGTIRRDGIRNGKYYNLIQVDILKPEWKAKQER